jgi:hypothetical protein
MPIDKRFRLAETDPSCEPSPWYVVIGVSRPAATHGLDDIDEPTVYSPLAAGLETVASRSSCAPLTGGPDGALRQLASAVPERIDTDVTSVDKR